MPSSHRPRRPMPRPDAMNPIVLRLTAPMHRAVSTEGAASPRLRPAVVPKVMIVSAASAHRVLCLAGLRGALYLHA